MKKSLLMIVAFLIGFAVRGTAQVDGSCIPVAVSPADGETINKLETVTLTFPYEVSVNQSAKCSVFSAEEEASTEAIAYARLSLSPDGDYTKVILSLHNTVIETQGSYKVVIPAEAIWNAEDESQKSAELTYAYKVDPDYWNPEWVIEVGANCTQEAPCQLKAGFKYNFTEMYTYFQYTATEAGRVYLTIAEDKYNEMSSRTEDWMHISNLPEMEDGVYSFGVEVGNTYYFCNYGFGSRIFTVTFEAGTPYEPITLIETSPVDGSMYSKSVSAEHSNTRGAVDFVFTHQVDMDALGVFIVLPSKDNKEIDVTEDVMLELGTVWGVGSYLSVDLRTVIDDIKATNGLKAGDKILVVLKNVQDVNFADNKLAENPKVELKLAVTMCTSVYPDGTVEAIPSELSLQFDGSVACKEGAKGWIIDTKSGNKQEFAIENFECTSRENWDGSLVYMATVTLPEVTIELTSKRFTIQLEGLVDNDGNVVSYGDEAGKFIVNCKFRDDTFNPVSVDPEDGADVESMKSLRLTFAEEVHINPKAEAPYFYAGDNEIPGTATVAPNDPKSVIITWSEEIKKAGSYNVTVLDGLIYDSKFDADKDDYGVADGASYNPYMNYTYYIPADVSATVVASVTPAPTGWMETISQLPEEVVIEFEGSVKEVLTAYSEVKIGWSEKDSLPEDATPLQHRIEENKVILTIPAEHISTVTLGRYIITVKALGEDGKSIGYEFDEYGDYNPYGEIISFGYDIYKCLELVEMTPADYATVKQLDKVVLTFSEDISEVDTYGSVKLWDEMWDNFVEPTITYEGKVATLTFDPAITVAGFYELVITQGYFATEEYLSNNEMYLGFTVDPDFEPEAEPLAIVSATPDNGAIVANLTAVEFKLNKKVGYLYPGMLIPADGGDDAPYAALTQSESDPTSYTLDFTLQNEDGVALRKGVTYTMTLEAWASEDAFNRNQGTPETVTLTYVGDSEGTQFSDVTLVSINPVEGTVISDKSQNKFVLKFSAAVNMVEDLTFINMGQGVTEKFESIVANADKSEYTLTIADDVMAGLTVSVNIVFAADDLAGKRVQGNDGDIFVYEYASTIVNGIKGIEVDADVEVTVYNVTGLKVAQGKAFEVLKKLPKGLYIVNGKKTVIK